MLGYISFELILVILTLLTGIVVLWHIGYLKYQGTTKTQSGWLVEHSKACFPILLTVLLIRSFAFQPYQVPTGSLEPTILPGDFILVSQYAYGLRLPILKRKILDLGSPKRGDIVLFHWPVNPHIVYAKRLVGLPGDHLIYRNKILYINNVPAKQTTLDTAFDIEPNNLSIPALKKLENLSGRLHNILIHQNKTDNTDFEVVVPPNHYFMMGDNRDNSYDSRYWGPVPDRYLIGRALAIWMSWDKQHHHVRWKRIGKTLSPKHE